MTITIQYWWLIPTITVVAGLLMALFGSEGHWMPGPWQFAGVIMFFMSIGAFIGHFL